MTGFLGRLFQYRATERKSPAEDFFTEAFAGVLSADDGETAAAFASWLTERNFRRARVVTQKVVDEGRLDMELVAEDGDGRQHLIVVENKLGAKEGDNQLPRYQSYLDSQVAESRTLVYLTRGEARDLPGSESVCFRNRHWCDVYEWLAAWVEGCSERPGVLARELLTLMEEWGMEVGLGAQDLAASVAYKTRVQHQLLQILDRVWEVCKKDATGGQWSYNRDGLEYTSAKIDDSGLYYMFGFDFSRSESAWNVSRLQLPSAYFAICGEDVGARDWSGLSGKNWKNPPPAWGWTDERVRELDSLKTDGVSLHQSYLDFFLSALAEAKEALGS